MDGLHYEVVINILSFLSGNDIVRFKRLNSNFRETIKENRYNLNHPKFTMYIDHETGEYWEEMEIINVILYGLKHCKDDCGVVRCKVNFKDPHGVKVTIDRKYCRKLCPPLVYHHCTYECNIFYPLLWGKTSLRSFFDFVLEKGDVEIKTSSINNPEVLRALTESIKFSTCRIRTVKMGAPASKEEYDLLMAVASNKPKHNCYPRLQIQCFVSHLTAVWTDLKKLNEIASMFTKARMQFVEDDINTVAYAITENWKLRPFPRMNFSLRIGRFYCMNATPWNAGIHYKIIIDEKNQLQFEKREPSVTPGTLGNFVRPVRARRPYPPVPADPRTGFFPTW